MLLGVFYDQNKIFFLFSLCLIIHLPDCLSQKKNEKLSDRLAGQYLAYKMFDEKTTEMSYSDAKKFLNKKMVIKNKQFILFIDTVEFPVYEHKIISKDIFLNEYDVDRRKFKNLKDELSTLFVTKKDEHYEEARIIILSKELIVNYRGYFYFFRRY